MLNFIFGVGGKKPYCLFCKLRLWKVKLDGIFLACADKQKTILTWGAPREVSDKTFTFLKGGRIS